jgi:putative restriction endonuclease
VEAAHIWPVEADGPDTIQNGVARWGTVNRMFDRRLIGLSDDLDIMVSRQVNDRASVDALINNTGRALAPIRRGDRPHSHFLAWHREHCFKA